MALFCRFATAKIPCFAIDLPATKTFIIATMNVTPFPLVFWESITVYSSVYCSWWRWYYLLFTRGSVCPAKSHLYMSSSDLSTRKLLKGRRQRHERIQSQQESIFLPLTFSLSSFLLSTLWRGIAFRTPFFPLSVRSFQASISSHTHFCLASFSTCSPLS